MLCTQFSAIYLLFIYNRDSRDYKYYYFKSFWSCRTFVRRYFRNGYLTEASFILSWCLSLLHKLFSILIVICADKRGWSKFCLYTPPRNIVLDSCAPRFFSYALIYLLVGTMSKTAIRLSLFCDLVIDLDSVVNPSSPFSPLLQKTLKYVLSSSVYASFVLLYSTYLFSTRNIYSSALTAPARKRVSYHSALP